MDKRDRTLFYVLGAGVVAAALANFGCSPQERVAQPPAAPPPALTQTLIGGPVASPLPVVDALPARKAKPVKVKKPGPSAETLALEAAIRSSWRGTCLLIVADVKGDYYVRKGNLSPHPSEFEVAGMTDRQCADFIAGLR